MPLWSHFVQNLPEHPAATAQIFIAPTHPAKYAEIKQQLFTWRESWRESISSTFITCSFPPASLVSSTYPQQRRRVLVVVASKEALQALPENTDHILIPPLHPVPAMAAVVGNQSYAISGIPVAGTKHFAPGSTVYPHQVYSGDGYERTYVTGRHRETNKYITIMCATARFEQWRRVEATDPIVIYELRYNGAMGWQGQSLERIDTVARGMNGRIQRLRDQ